MDGVLHYTFRVRSVRIGQHFVYRGRCCGSLGPCDGPIPVILLLGFQLFRQVGFRPAILTFFTGHLFEVLKDVQHFSAKTLLTSTVVEFGLELCQNTVVPGFWVLGFIALPGFRALKAGDGAWSVHKKRYLDLGHLFPSSLFIYLFFF